MVGWKSVGETVQHPCPFRSPNLSTQTEDWRSSLCAKDTKHHWRTQRPSQQSHPGSWNPGSSLTHLQSVKARPSSSRQATGKVFSGDQSRAAGKPRSYITGFAHGYVQLRGFLSGSAGKNPPTRLETQVWSLGREDPLEEVMATHSIVLLPGDSHGQRSLGGYSPWGRRESDTNEVTGGHVSMASQITHREFHSQQAWLMLSEFLIHSLVPHY